MNDLNDDRAYKAMLKKEVQLERELRDENERLRAEVEYWKGYTEQAMQHRDEAERLWHRETAAELQRLRAENASQRELIAWSIGDPTDAANEIERLRVGLERVVAILINGDGTGRAIDAAREALKEPADER